MSQARDLRGEASVGKYDGERFDDFDAIEGTRMKSVPVSQLQDLGRRLQGATSRIMPRARSAKEGATTPLLDMPSVSAIQAEGMERLYQVSSLGLVPLSPGPGKAQLGEMLSLTGTDISFLRVLPGTGTPFAMQHRKDEVVYVVTEGKGQFLIDDEPIDVAAGTLLRVAPTAARAWRNTSSEDLCMIVIQARAGRRLRSKRSDAVGLPRRLLWPTRWSSSS